MPPNNRMSRIPTPFSTWKSIINSHSSLYVVVVGINPCNMERAYIKSIKNRVMRTESSFMVTQGMCMPIMSKLANCWIMLRAVFSLMYQIVMSQRVKWIPSYKITG